MKKIFLITFFLAFAISQSAYGQVDLNFLAGINNSSCKFENFTGISPKSRWGYFIGVGTNYPISEKVQFLIDFQYSLKGYNLGNNNNLSASGFRYSYIDIIPEIEYKVLNYLVLGAGINYAIKLDEEQKFENKGWVSAKESEVIKSSDFGLTGKIKVFHRNIFGFIRYNLGLSDIADATFTDENGQEIENAKQLNRNLQFGIGYKFNLRKKKK